MSEALERAAKAMEDAEVGALELQACNVGAIEGLASFSFADRLEHLLSTPTHPVRVKKHTRYVSTGVDSQTKKTMVWIGSNPRADGNELSATTLPPFVDTR
jgi:hypothetical protein